MQGNELLLNAERVNQRLLPIAEHLQRQNLEMAENPNQ